MFKNHIKIAYRTLSKHKVYSLINILGLTIGMTAAFFIFIWVKNEINYDQYHPDSELIYQLISDDGVSKTKGDRTPYLLGEELAKQSPDIKGFTRIRPITGIVPTVRIENEFFKEKSAAHVDEHWFEVFHFDFIKGNSKSFNEHAYSVILSESKAKKYFGKQEPIGKTLSIDGETYLVQGVIKDSPPNSSFHYDFYMPVAARHANPFWKNQDQDLFRNQYRTYVKLMPDATPAKITGQANSILKQGAGEKATADLLQLKDAHFASNIEFSDLKHGDSKMTYILLLIGVLLLLIACINYVNLTTARASSRIKEVGVQKVIGAKRNQLFFQFIVESGLLVFISLIGTLMLVYFCLPLFNGFVDNQFTWVFIGPALLQIISLTVVCTLLLTSIYPAILLSSLKPLSVLGGRYLGMNNKGSLRKSLVVVQFVISIVLIIGTVVIYSQMAYINKQYSNYDKAHVFSFLVPFSDNGDTEDQRVESMKQELLAYHSIQEVAGGFSLIDVSNAEGPFDWEGRNRDIQYEINLLGAGSDCDQVLDFTMKEGRWFLPNSSNDAKNFVLNETAVKELDIRQPVIGQRFVHGEDVGVIVGVVKDFHFHGMREKIAPMVFTNNPFYYLNSFILKTAPGQQAEALKFTEGVFKKFFPNEPFDYQFVDNELNQLYRADQKVTSMVTASSLLAIFVSCMGLFGLATFIAEKRNKEIGIRKVLGASVMGIVQLLSSDFVKLVILALVIASPIAWWAMNKWLQDFAYHIDIQWWMFALAGMLAVAIALFTVSFQAVKAAIANPVDSLRDE